MDSLRLLIDRLVAARLEEADALDGDGQATAKAMDARYALDLRMVQLTGFLEGLYEAGAPGAAAVLNKIDPGKYPTAK